MAESGRIDTELLLEWLEGRLAPEQAREIERRLAEHGDQADEVRWLRSFLAASAAVTLQTPDADLHAALLAQFRPSPLARAARRIAAALSFDSVLQPAPAGMRSAGAQARQVIFESEVAEIAVSMRPSRQSDLLDVTGQLFARSAAELDGLAVQLSRAGELVDVSLTNEVGEFQFTALSPGVYALLLTIDGDQVAADPLTLQITTS